MTTNNDYCAECHGRPHAPWCSRYVEHVRETRLETELTRELNRSESLPSRGDYSDEQERVASPCRHGITGYCFPCVHERHNQETLDGKYDDGTGLSESTALRNTRSDNEQDAAVMCPDCGYYYYKSNPHVCADWTRGAESTALRNTKLIAHHAEMVAEQVRKERGNCLECRHGGNLDPRGRCQETRRDPGGSMVYCGCKCFFLDTAAGQIATTPTTDFEHAWAELLESDRRVTEIAVAQKLYYAGRRDRETEMLREVNETLRGVVERIGREGRK